MLDCISKMQSVLPYTTNPDQMGLCEKMKLVDPHCGSVTGPCVSLKKIRRVASGVLHSWDAEAAQSLTNPPPRPLTWDLSWTAAENKWEQNVLRCHSPEEVEDLLPSKWIAYNMQSETDETLAKVCKLCTALVDRFVELSQGNNASISTGKWRQHQSLCDRLGAVMELLEASVGEAIPILKLREPSFIRECWAQMPDEERNEVISALNAPEY